MGNHPIPSKQLRKSNGYSAQIWQTTDRSRQLISVWRLIADGVPVKQACADVGIDYIKYHNLWNNNKEYEKRHRQAMDARKTLVEDALVDVALGRTQDVIEQYDADGVLMGRQVRKYAPDAKAAHKFLASRNPEQFSERVDLSSTFEVYNPLAISVQPVNIQDAETVETTANAVKVDL
jgi:hypothetical protein